MSLKKRMKEGGFPSKFSEAADFARMTQLNFFPALRRAVLLRRQKNILCGFLPNLRLITGWVRACVIQGQITLILSGVE